MFISDIFFSYFYKIYYYTLFRITNHQKVNNVSTKEEKGAKVLNVTSLSVGVKGSGLWGV